MCTIVVLIRPESPWPLIVAANRDEMIDRVWRPPGRHWSDRPAVVAGRDETAGGTWLGVNDFGVVAAVSNRRGALGPAPGMSSRGELPLAALDCPTARLAGDAIEVLDGARYRPFNLVVADRDGAVWLRRREDSVAIERFDIPAGLSMLTAGDLDDETSPRIRMHLGRFRAAPPPDPGRDDWSAWQALLASRVGAAVDDQAAMTVDSDFGFATVSSSLIAVSADAAKRPVWLFAPGPPDTTRFAPVEV